MGYPFFIKVLVQHPDNRRTEWKQNYRDWQVERHNNKIQQSRKNAQIENQKGIQKQKDPGMKSLTNS